MSKKNHSGEELRYYRKTLGLTIAQAAAKYADDKGKHRTPAAWSNMESGKTAIPAGIELLIKMEADDQGIRSYAPAAQRLTTAHLSAFRRKYGLSQSAIADQLNKSLSAWKRYEAGTTQIPSTLRPALIALAKKLTEEK